MPIKTLGPRVRVCPKCGEDLFDSIPEKNEKGEKVVRIKECPTCDLVFKKFRKMKGIWSYWRMGTIEEHMDYEIERAMNL